MNQRLKAAGFTLLELLVAMAIFLVIGGTTLGLFAQHVPLFSRQQGQASLNVQIRNSIIQLQTDVVNGGSGYVTGTDLPAGVLGVTITNSNPAIPCNDSSTYVYGYACFDTLNVINAEPTVPAAHPENGNFSPSYSTTETDCITTNAGSIFVYPPTGVTAAALAADYDNAYTNLGETELLLINSGGTEMTTIMLNAPPSAGTKNGVPAILLSYQVTTPTGTNAAMYDPLNISIMGNGNPMISNSFWSEDYVLELAPITYSVDTSTPTDPELVRTQNGVSTVLAQQVIGFKVGAMLKDVLTTCTGDLSMVTDSPLYCYDSANDGTGYASQWTQIRAVQIALIGRTNPDPGSTYTYRNSFDGGPYQIEGVSTVINPRNMSMNDADF